MSYYNDLPHSYRIKPTRDGFTPQGYCTRTAQWLDAWELGEFSHKWRMYFPGPRLVFSTEDEAWQHMKSRRKPILWG